jgi:ABC-type spermidine/putrescine transport system permease subunit I
MSLTSASLTNVQNRPLWRERLAMGLVILPPFLYLLILYVLPAGIMLTYSFWTIDQNYQLVPAWNLEEYQYFTTQPAYTQILMRSFQMALLNTVISLLVAYPLAYFLSRYARNRWKNLLLVMLIAPAWTSFLIRIYAWMLILGDNGLINFTLRGLNLISEPLPLLFNQTSLLIGLLYIYLPYMLLPIYASLEKINPSLLEAAQALGANPLRTFLRVTLPLSLPGVVAGCMITFIPTLGEYVAPAILGGRTGYMYGNLIAEQFSIFDWPLGAAMAAILLACVLALVFAFSRLIRLQEVWSG